MRGVRPVLVINPPRDRAFSAAAVASPEPAEPAVSHATKRMSRARTALASVVPMMRSPTPGNSQDPMNSLGLIAGGIAHDFNNILAAIVGYADLVDSAVEPQHHVRADLAHIRAAAIRGMAMTGQLLTFSRREPIEPALLDDGAPPHSLAPLVEMMGPSVSLLGGAGAAPPDVEVHELYAALVESAEDAIFTKRLDGTITSWNPGAARLYGYSPGEIVGQSVTILAPPDHLDEIPAILARIAAGDRIEHFETVRLHQDGSPRHVALTISPIRDRDRKIVAASTVARDISARKSAEEQLLQAQKLESIGRLAGGIAHDFNNMLTAIRGYADMLADDLAPDRRSESDLAGSVRSVAGISYAAERASALTAQLLAFSRQQPVSPRVAELNAGVHSVQPMLRRLIGENLRLAFKLDPAAGNILADPGQLDQILINLVVNARDAMPDGGTISIETGSADFDEPYALEHFEVEPGPYAMLAVSDTGVGMDRETRTHIFEPFFSTKDVGKGTGLGLATTYGIVRQAGGHIWLYSEPGVGSTFKLYFPRVDAAVTVETEARPDPLGKQTGVVMVVEDEPVVREVTIRLLERAGYKVVVVDDGVEAVAMLEKMTDPIDVLVTDVIMPNMSGISLGDWVLNRYPQIGVVLLSGYTAETLDLDRIVARGAVFLSKPFSAVHLLQAVAHARASEHANI